jgi:transposase-like protein
MGEHRRKADGRRVFSTEFKRTAVQRILTGEKTLAELSGELDISPSVIRNWSGSRRPGDDSGSRPVRMSSPPVSCGRHTPRSGSFPERR